MNYKPHVNETITIRGVTVHIAESSEIVQLNDRTDNQTAADTMQEHRQTGLVDFVLGTQQKFYLVGVWLTVSGGSAAMEIYEGATADATTTLKMTLPAQGITGVYEYYIDHLEFAAEKFIVIKPIGANIENTDMIGYII